MKQRTTQQNKAYWKWLTDVGNELEAQGITRKTLAEDLDDANIPITPKFLHEAIWQHYMVGMFGKTSTTELETDEMTKVADAVALHLQENYGLQAQWPSADAQNFNEVNDIY